MLKNRNIGFYPITITIIALALIWIVGHGEAGEAGLKLSDATA